METKYYHITENLEAYQSIKATGLNADEEGYIYLLTNKNIAGYVAKNQLGYRGSFALLQINSKGIDEKPEMDNVGEYTAQYQRRIKQSLIETKYIKLENMHFIK